MQVKSTWPGTSPGTTRGLSSNDIAAAREPDRQRDTRTSQGFRIFLVYQTNGRLYHSEHTPNRPGVKQPDLLEQNQHGHFPQEFSLDCIGLYPAVAIPASLLRLRSWNSRARDTENPQITLQTSLAINCVLFHWFEHCQGTSHLVPDMESGRTQYLLCLTREFSADCVWPFVSLIWPDISGPRNMTRRIFCDRFPRPHRIEKRTGWSSM